MSRNAAGLGDALERIPALRDQFWQNVCVSGTNDELNVVLEKAGRVADFLEFAELMIEDALQRQESCGGHFREESQTEEGEARRDDQRFSHVAAWEFTGDGQAPRLHEEPLTFEYVKPAQRSYK
jgi:succinate dehydrogenase / fumarate reductase flavoprotein subunit